MSTLVARSMGTTWVQIPAPLLASWVTLARCLNLSELQRHHLEMGTVHTSERGCRGMFSAKLCAEGSELGPFPGEHGDVIHSANPPPPPDCLLGARPAPCALGSSGARKGSEPRTREAFRAGAGRLTATGEWAASVGCAMARKRYSQLC